MLCDADNDHFGREDYIQTLEKLYQELVYKGVENDKKAWFQKQVSMLENHEFYTNAAEMFRKVNKEKQEMDLKNYIESL